MNYTVKKFTVSDYILITSECKDVAKAVMLLDSKDKQEQAAAFADVIATALPQVVKIVSLATGVNEDDIKKIDDISIIIDVLAKIVDINDFLALKKTVFAKFQALKTN